MAKSRQQGSEWWQSLSRSPLALISAILILLLGLAALFAPWLSPQNPYDLATLNLSDAFQPPLWLPGGHWPYLLGTDNLGRGILSTILYGLRISFVVGLSVVLLAGGMGIVTGLWAGYRGGWLDALLMRLADTVFSFSTTLMAILIMGLLKARGVGAVVFAIAITDWVRYARTARGSTLTLKPEEFVSAAQALGAGSWRILTRHILPNALPPLLVIAAVDFAVVVILEATLSFLGIGVPITQPSLGMMIAIGSKYLYAGYWWMIVFPCAVLILLTMAVNLLGDWLRTELDPH
ncbi:MAG TPA: ABC transporter permease [Candidatus Fraserbacteria bacterium]|nr:ABC transporter permease [Candidatus Fraserbacteria bacterium]